jgi:membrane-bound serine protease (ClpP class)
MMWALLLILLGLLLLVAEVFIPSSGILFVLSMVALVIGVTMMFYASPAEGGGPVTGLITLGILFVLIPVIVAASFYYWPRTPVGKRFFLPGPEDATIAATPESLGQEKLLGQIGKTLTPHRPSGATFIDGRRVDTSTEGLFVEADQWVRVVDVRPGQVLVRPLSDRELRDVPEDWTA